MYYHIHRFSAQIARAVTTSISVDILLLTIAAFSFVDYFGNLFLPHGGAFLLLCIDQRIYLEFFCLVHFKINLKLFCVL